MGEKDINIVTQIIDNVCVCVCVCVGWSWEKLPTEIVESWIQTLGDS